MAIIKNQIPSTNRSTVSHLTSCITIQTDAAATTRWGLHLGRKGRSGEESERRGSPTNFSPTPMQAQGAIAHAPPLGAHACSVGRGPRDFPFTRPVRQAPVPPSFSFSLVPKGRIPRIHSLPAKLLSVPESLATHLGGFGSFPFSPAPRHQPERPRREQRGQRARVRVMWAWPGVGVAWAAGGRTRRTRFRRGLPGP